MEQTNDNQAALTRLLARLEGLERLPLPLAPGATLVMGLLDDPRTGGKMTVSGCHSDPAAAFAACAGEAAEFLAQTSVPAAPGSPEPGIERWTFERQLGPAPGPGGWILAKRLPDMKTVAVPHALCRYLPASDHLDISTGCAAAPTLDGAIFHGICEIIERDASSRWKAGEVQPSLIPMTPGLTVWLDDARGGQKERSTRLLDIGHGGPMPVVIAVSFDSNGQALSYGVSAHPNPQVAATGAMREMLQMEFGLQLARYKRDLLGPETVTGADAELLRISETTSATDPLVNPFKTGAPEGPYGFSGGAGDLESLLAHLALNNQPAAFAALSEQPGLCVAKVFLGNIPLQSRSFS